MTLEASVLRQRLANIQWLRHLGNVSQACREAGISPTLFYRRKRRLLRYGLDGLRPRPSWPTRWSRQATPALEHAMMAYALQVRHPRCGGWRVSRVSMGSSVGTACAPAGSAC